MLLLTLLVIVSCKFTLAPFDKSVIKISDCVLGLFPINNDGLTLSSSRPSVSLLFVSFDVGLFVSSTYVCNDETAVCSGGLLWTTGCSELLSGFLTRDTWLWLLSSLIRSWTVRGLGTGRGEVREVDVEDGGKGLCVVKYWVTTEEEALSVKTEAPGVVFDSRFFSEMKGELTAAEEAETLSVCIPSACACESVCNVLFCVSAFVVEFEPEKPWS